jgi:hypothetical protein
VLLLYGDVHDSQHTASSDRFLCLQARQAHFRSARTERTEKTPSDASPGAAAVSGRLQEEDLDAELLAEIAREDELAAEATKGKPVVYDLFPPPPPRLTMSQQRERAFKLSRRPLRSVSQEAGPHRRPSGVSLSHGDKPRYKDCRTPGTRSDKTCMEATSASLAWKGDLRAAPG